jgi:hypothetical protein
MLMISISASAGQVLPLPELAASTGKICDCQHLPGSMLAGSG